MTTLFEKKLGRYYLLTMEQNEKNIFIILYKKWSKYDGFEETNNVLKYDVITEREKALSIYNGINLKSLKTIFGWKISHE